MENPDRKKTKIVFWGTSDFAGRILEKLLAAGWNVSLVMTQPDKKAGRSQEIVTAQVKIIAVKKELRYLQPENLLDKTFVKLLLEADPDLMIVAAYGKILPVEILRIPEYGTINVHASLLPKYRGASPIQSAILAGDQETGVTLMLMNEKLDQGDILAQKKVPIRPDDNCQALTASLAEAGSQLLVDKISDFLLGKIKGFRQDKFLSSYSAAIARTDGEISWADSAGIIGRKWRAYFGWPGIFTHFDDGGRKKLLKIVDLGVLPPLDTRGKPGKVIKFDRRIAVETGEGLVELKKVQPEGGKAMAISDFVRGKPNFIGSLLGNHNEK